MLKIFATTDNLQTNLRGHHQQPKDCWLDRSYDLKVIGGVGRVCTIEIVTAKTASINQPLQIRLHMRKHSHPVPLDIHAEIDALAVLSKARIMIQNEGQYKITRSKLKELLLARVTLDLPSDLYPRQVLAQKNSLGILIAELEQEILEYNRLQSDSDVIRN